MNFDPLSFVIGKHGDSGPVRDVVSYLIGRVAGTAGEIWQILTNVAVASFTTVSATLRELVVDITPVQSGSGDPSPTNVRPISGWAGANITRTNVNRFLTLPVASGQKLSAPIGIVAGTKYTIETTVTGYRTSTNAFVVVYDRNGNELASYTSSGNINLGIDPSHPLTFTAPEGTAYCKFVFFKSGVTTCPFDPTNTYMHEGDPVGDIVVGVNNTYTVTFPSEAGMVYGGTLRDNGDGTWTLTALFEKVTLTTGNWIKDTTRNRFYKSIPHGKDAALLPRSISNCFSYSPSSTSGAENIFTPGASADTVWFVLPADSEISSVAAWENWITSNPVDVVLPLSTPQTYTLTADSVQALLGQNNIFADTGNINTITFRTH